MRLFFASDIHGSTSCFKKLVNAGAFYKVDAVVMGGDLSGKELVPLVETRSGWTASYRGAARELATEREAAEFERRVATFGGYTARLAPEQVAALRADPELVEETLHSLIRERTKEWVEFAADRLGDSGRSLHIGLGNDDFDDLADLLDEGPVRHAQEGAISFGEYWLVSLGWSNPTPWATHRECGEDELGHRLDAMTRDLDPDRTLLNVHVPPFGSGLDLAPRLDADLQIQLEGGEPDLVPVGSTAVAAHIREFEPLVSLHGHIHEGRGVTSIGRTTVVNPGSEYDQATLLGAIVDIRPRKKIRTQLVTG